MKSLSVIVALLLVFAGSSRGQTFNETVAKVRQIKLLVSTRDDVKRILRSYEATDDTGHYHRFSNEDLTITVEYSSGSCTDDADEEDASEIWNVKEWVVTRIEIDPEEPITLQNAGLNLSTFKKEPRYPDNTDALVFYDKATGVAVKTIEEGIEKLIFFPPRANSNKLCRISSAAKGFYTRKGWFSQAKPDDIPICVNEIAHVTDLTLSASEINETSNPTVSVTTLATDPENDVLTYNYSVTGGRIVGTGATVTWDLTGVSPGTYTITAGVDDGCGICGKTMTKTVVVK